MLYDTGAALTSGYLQHHLNIQAKCLECVHSLEVFDGDNPFDPIKLLGAIDNPDNYDPGRHGLLSAVVHYYTPYQDNDGKPLLLDIALGDSMAMNTIFGNTVIKQWRLEYQFDPAIIKIKKCKKRLK